MRINTTQDLLTTLDDLEASYMDLGRAEAAICFKTMAYFEGKQWRRSNGPFPYHNNSGGTQLRTQYNPDRADLRVVDNFTTTLALRVAAKTFPSTMEVDVFPGDRDVGEMATMRQQVAEDAINTGIDLSGFLQARRAANMGRTIMGDYAIGMSLECVERPLDVRGRAVVAHDYTIKCFTADPTKFILDPFESSGNLEDHDIVVYRDVWTVHRLRRMYPQIMGQIDEARLRTVQQLAPFENSIAEITDSRLFAQYQRYSRTKGAKVYQVHVKGQDGRFGQMFVVVDAEFRGATNETKRVVNADDPSSPFGGCGMPFALYHAHQRSESPWSVSDVLNIIDAQNRRNLAKTIHYRHENQYAGFKWNVDKRFFKTGEVEDALNKLNNRVGGAIVGEGDKSMGVEGPKVVQIPPPSPTLLDIADREYDMASEMVGRPPVTGGETKSHVPNSTFQSAINQADQIGNVRVQLDVETDARFLTMMLGTMVKCVQGYSPSTIQALQKRGFEEEDLAVMMAMDPNDPGLRVVVRQSTVRNRSHELRRTELIDGVQNQLLTPLRARAALSSIDSELVTDDKAMTREATRAAMAVLMGQEWTPRPLGEWSEFFVDAFRRSLVDPKARNDMEALARLTRAIHSQTQLAVQEQIMSDPKVQAEMQMTAQQAAAKPPAEGAVEPEGDIMSIPGLMQAIEA